MTASSLYIFTFKIVSAELFSGWNMFVAAMTSNQDLRTKLISRVHNRASFNQSAGVFPVNYDSGTGATILGGAR